MIYRATPIDDYWLTEGVLARRVFAWLIDVLLIGLILAALWLVLLLFGAADAGPRVPAARRPAVRAVLLSSAVRRRLPPRPRRASRRWGWSVRRNDDLGRPTPVQAFIYTLLFYLTLATTGLLLLFALFTIRQRTLHDLASGLVVVRARALTGGLGSWNMQGGSPYA